MEELCDLKVHINGQHTFLLNQRILCSFSGRLRRMVKQEKKRTHHHHHPKTSSEIKITDFPRGPEGFELVSRFCYSNGRIPMSPSNISLLHCSALLLEMTEDIKPCNLITQTETFLDGLFYWTWDDILTSLKACEPFFNTADSSGLMSKLISSLLAKISAHSDFPLTTATPFFQSSPSSSSSPDTPDSIKLSSTKEWWFDDMTILPPNIIERVLRALEAFGTDNKNLILTRFLLHYLKIAVQKAGNGGLVYKLEYGGLADTAVYGVVLMGRSAFSCRGLFWVLRVVSCFGVSRECRQKLERVIGLVLDQATLDDLLVSGHDGGVYDVNLVLRLVRIFVGGGENGGMSLNRMKKVGRLVDKYLGEISPDQGLKVGRFLGVAESLPDLARDCFDGVYRALDIYLESHPTLSSEERTRLCRCLNYEKLTLETCKDLAKNPRIPPGAAIQALVSQQCKLQPKMNRVDSHGSIKPRGAVVVSGDESEFASSSSEAIDEKEELRLNLQRMQNRVVELEKVCMEMKCQMSKIVKGKPITISSHQSSRGMTRLC